MNQIFKITGLFRFIVLSTSFVAFGYFLWLGHKIWNDVVKAKLSRWTYYVLRAFRLNSEECLSLYYRHLKKLAY